MGDHRGMFLPGDGCLGRNGQEGGQRHVPH